MIIPLTMCCQEISRLMAYIHLSDPTTAGLLGDNLIREEDIDRKLIFRNKYLQCPRLWWGYDYSALGGVSTSVGLLKSVGSSSDSSSSTESSVWNASTHAEQ